jgi:hypothetical protein
MTFQEVLKYIRVGDSIPYRNANGRLTNGGRFVVARVQNDLVTIRIQNGNYRSLAASDWNEVEQNLSALRRNRSVCQSMQTRNSTYVFSLRWWPPISSLLS